MTHDPRIGQAKRVLAHAPLAGLAAVFIAAADEPSAAHALFSSSQLLLVFFTTSCLTFIAASLFCSFAAVLGQREVPPRWLRTGGPLLSAGIFLVGLLAPVESAALSAAGGILCGAGAALLCVLWASALERQPLARILLICAAACLGGSLLKGVGALAGLSSLAGTLPLAVLALVAALAPRRAALDADPSRDLQEPSAQGAPTGAAPAESFRSLWTENWIPYFGLLLSLTILAGIWGDPLLTGADSITARDAVAGCLVASLVLGSAAIFSGERSLKITLLVLPLACIALTIGIWFFREVDPAKSVSFIPLGFATITCGCIFLAQACSTDGPAHLIQAFTALAATVACAVFVGWFAIRPLLGFDIASMIDLLMKVAYMLAAAVWIVVRSQRQPVATTPPPPTLEETCARFGSRFGLSKRELEILVHLMQGRSAAYIAEKQFVSPNTVKSHIQRIYAKADVHSKQELIDLVHGEEAADRP